MNQKIRPFGYCNLLSNMILAWHVTNLGLLLLPICHSLPDLMMLFISRNFTNALRFIYMCTVVRIAGVLSHTTISIIASSASLIHPLSYHRLCPVLGLRIALKIEPLEQCTSTAEWNKETLDNNYWILTFRAITNKCSIKQGQDTFVCTHEAITQVKC